MGGKDVSGEERSFSLGEVHDGYRCYSNLHLCSRLDPLSPMLSRNLSSDPSFQGPTDTYPYTGGHEIKITVEYYIVEEEE